VRPKIRVKRLIYPQKFFFFRFLSFFFFSFLSFFQFFLLKIVFAQNPELETGSYPNSGKWVLPRKAPNGGASSTT
jgi:hypothetical protein